MITFFIILGCIALGVIVFGYYYNASITFAPIIGIMMGSLYSFTDLDEGREHTFQVCIAFLSITVQWIEN